MAETIGDRIARLEENQRENRRRLQDLEDWKKEHDRWADQMVGGIHNKIDAEVRRLEGIIRGVEISALGEIAKLKIETEAAIANNIGAIRQTVRSWAIAGTILMGVVGVVGTLATIWVTIQAFIQSKP